MNKHTDGPWKVFNAWQNGDAINFSRIGNEHETIITIQNSDDITAFNEADLHLIAAAPELLEVLEEIIDCPNAIDSATVPRAGIDANREQVVLEYSIALVRIDKARAAIAKAKGEQ